MSFAAALATLNNTVTAQLADAVLTYSEIAVPVVFTRAEDSQGNENRGPLRMGGVTRQHLASAPAAAFTAGLPERGSTVDIDGADWTVGTVDRDLSGMLTLHVSRAAA